MGTPGIRDAWTLGLWDTTMACPPVLRSLVEHLPGDLQEAFATQYLPRIPAGSGISPRDISFFHSFDVAELLHKLDAEGGRRGHRTPTLSVIASIHAPDAAALMVSCGNPSCPQRNRVDFSTLLICSRCRTMKYCDANCQREDWGAHKRLCKAAAAAADRREAAGAHESDKEAELVRNSFRASRMVAALCNDIGALYAAWVGRFDGMPGVIFVECPDLVSWSGGPADDAEAFATGGVDFGVVPDGGESGVAFLSFLPLAQLATYVKHGARRDGSDDRVHVPHTKTYPPCQGPAATQVAPRRLHETLLGPTHRLNSSFITMLTRSGIMSERGGKGSVDVADAIFIVVRDARSGFVKCMSMQNPYPPGDISSAVEARWESAVNERLAHADVIAARGDGQRFALNYHCVDSRVVRGE